MRGLVLVVLLSALATQALADNPPLTDGVKWSVSVGGDHARYFTPDRSIEVKDWQAAEKLLPRDKEASSLWSIYDHPTDHPESLVVRETVAGPGGIVISPAAIYVQTLEEAHTKLPPGSAQLPRSPGDPQNLLETWLAP